MTRRDLLASSAVAAVAGCLGDRRDGVAADGDGTPPRTDDEADDLTEACPTTGGLDERRDGLDREVVGPLDVEAYDDAYVREVVVGYESDSRLDEHELSGGIRGEPTERDGGYVLEVRGGGAVYEPNLHLDAAVAEAPADAERVPNHEADEAIRGLLAAAVEVDDADDERTRGRVEDGEAIDAHLDSLAALFETFDPLEGPGDSSALYFDVELSVSADTSHGDYGWRAQYYVDERHLRRTVDGDDDPVDGDLLECREGG